MADIDELEDTSLYFTDGHVIAKDNIVIAAKLNALSEEDFSRVLYFKNDEWSYEDIDDSVHSVWFVDEPRTVYWLGKRGTVTVVGGGKLRTETIQDASDYGSLNRIRQIGSELYICGYAGQIYRRAKRAWEHFDDGVLEHDVNAMSVDLQDIDGIDSASIYAVGTGGSAYHFDGKRWDRLDSPTNLHLLRVRCVSNDEVFICGSKGTLFRITQSGWEDLSDDEVLDDFWGIEYFNGQLYVAHAGGLMTWDGSGLRPVDMGTTKSVTTHHLHARDGVLWSFGIDDLFFFDGAKWTEVICPENEG
jgi:hypothetical protein